MLAGVQSISLTSRPQLTARSRPPMKSRVASSRVAAVGQHHHAPVGDAGRGSDATPSFKKRGRGGVRIRIWQQSEQELRPPLAPAPGRHATGTVAAAGTGADGLGGSSIPLHGRRAVSGSITVSRQARARCADATLKHAQREHAQLQAQYAQPFRVLPAVGQAQVIAEDDGTMNGTIQPGRRKGPRQWQEIQPRSRSSSQRQHLDGVRGHLRERGRNGAALGIQQPHPHGGRRRGMDPVAEPGSLRKTSHLPVRLLSSQRILGSGGSGMPPAQPD